MYESRRQPLIARADFLRRLVRHAAFALLPILGSLAIGMAGCMIRVLHRFDLDER